MYLIQGSDIYCMQYVGSVHMYNYVDILVTQHVDINQGPILRGWLWVQIVEIHYVR